MKYILNTLTYIVKAFPFLLIIFLIPSIVLGFFSVPVNSLVFLQMYSHSYLEGYADILGIMVDLMTFQRIYPVIIILITSVVCASLGCSVTEKHMRVGKLHLRRPLLGINYALVPTGITLLIFAVISLVYRVFLASIVSFINYFFAGGGVYPDFLTMLIISVLSVVLLGLLFLLAASMALWVPQMLISGYSFIDSAAASFKLASKDFINIFVGAVFPFVVCAAVQFIALLFYETGLYIDVIRIVCWLFLLMYLQVFCFVAYFELTGTKRMDLKRYYTN